MTGIRIGRETRGTECCVPRATLLLVALFGMVLTPWLYVLGQAEPAGSGLLTPRELPRLETSLRAGMEQLAQVYRVPMLIVLKAGPGKITLPAGKIALADALGAAVRQNPGYDWEFRDGVIYFHNRLLDGDPEYFMNWRLDEYPVQATAADNKLTLYAYLAKLREHVGGRGLLVEGLVDPELAQHHLPRAVLHDVTTAGAVLKILSLDRAFYSIIEFPGPAPLSDKDLDAAFVSWRWVPFAKNANPPAPKRPTIVRVPSP